MEIQEKINKLMQDEAFVAAFQNVVNAQDVVELFKQHDIEVPVEIAKELLKRMEEELDVDALDGVAGGVVIPLRGPNETTRRLLELASYLVKRLLPNNGKKLYK